MAQFNESNNTYYQTFMADEAAPVVTNESNAGFATK